MLAMVFRRLGQARAWFYVFWKAQPSKVWCLWCFQSLRWFTMWVRSDRAHSRRAKPRAGVHVWSETSSGSAGFPRKNIVFSVCVFSRLSRSKHAFSDFHFFFLIFQLKLLPQPKLPPPPHHGLRAAMKSATFTA